MRKFGVGLLLNTLKVFQLSVEKLCQKWEKCTSVLGGYVGKQRNSGAPDELRVTF